MSEKGYSKYSEIYPTFHKGHRALLYYLYPSVLHLLIAWKEALLLE